MFINEYMINKILMKKYKNKFNCKLVRSLMKNVIATDIE